MGLFRTPRCRRRPFRSVVKASATADASGTPALPAQSDTQHPAPGTFEVVFRTDPSIYDGRFANNGWLQELPKPLTKLTWDNAALVSPNTARQLGLRKHDRMERRRDSRRQHHDSASRAITITCPTWIMPGQPDDVITVHLGYGRQRAGRVGNNTRLQCLRDSHFGFALDCCRRQS